MPLGTLHNVGEFRQIILLPAASEIRTFTAVGNWSDETKWAQGAKPVNGDEVVIADGVICTIDEDTPNLAKIGTDGTAGTGQCKFSADVTVKFADMEAGASPQYEGFFYLDTANTVTLDGTVKGSSNASLTFRIGCTNFINGTIIITGGSIGGIGNTCYGSLNRGSGNTAGIIHIYGKTIGGGGGITNANGCFIHEDSRGTVYFYDDLEDTVNVAVVNVAGTDAMCYIAKDKQWYDADNNEKEFPVWLEYMSESGSFGVFGESSILGESKPFGSDKLFGHSVIF